MKKLIGKNLLVAVLLFLLSMMLWTCYATTSSLDLREKTPVPTGETIVFGRINVIMDNVPVTWGYTFMGRTEPGMFRVLIQSDTTSQAISHGLTGNGSFVWHLPPGGYTIVGFKYHTGTSGRIMAHFTVLEGSPLLYIGTLEFRMTKYTLYRMNITDEFEEAKQDLKSRFPELQGESVKSLMTLEKQK